MCTMRMSDVYHGSVGEYDEKVSKVYDGECQKNTVNLSDLYDESVGCVQLRVLDVYESVGEI